MKLPSIKRLRECFHVDYETGLLMWLERPLSHFTSEESQRQNNTRCAGLIAGHKTEKGYIRLSVDGTSIRAHRAVFALVHGRWPDGEIDHINGIRDDNRPQNLRECTGAENRRNTYKARGRSGVVGVSWSESARKWNARVRANGKSLSIGYYDTLEAAAHARHLAARQHYGEFAPQKQELTHD